MDQPDDKPTNQATPPDGDAAPADATGNSGESSGARPAIEGEVLTGRAKGYANLRPFKKGQSGNPAGRPKGIITDEYLWILNKAVPPEILAKVSPGALKLLGRRPRIRRLKAWQDIQKALSGDMGASREINARTEGRVPHTVTIARSDRLQELREALLAGFMEPGTSHPKQEEE